MRKLKIYLDTSVLSHLDQQDAQEKMNDTISLWKDFESGKYNIYVSELVLNEISGCSDEKQDNISTYLNRIEYTSLSNSVEAEKLAQSYIDNGVLTQKSFDDCQHIALAVIANCDIILSWNFKHMVKYKTIEGVRNTNAQNGYFKNIDIVQPTILLESED